MTSFSIFPLGGFLSVSLSMSYLRENKRTQRRKREQLCLSQNYQNNNDIWRSVPESTPHGAPHMYKSFEKAALVLRMASVTLSNFLTPAEHEAFYETLNDLEQRVQMCDSQLKRTVVIEGPQGFSLHVCLYVYTCPYWHCVTGCGASTLISNLTGDHPQSDYRESNILTLREKLKSLPQHLWAVLESVCDYCRIVNAELNPCHVTSDGIVFVERLYHSRLSSVLCMEDLFVDPSSLPASAYCWPKDLPHPALVLYLAVPFAERQHRPNQTPMTSGMYERNQVSVCVCVMLGHSFVLGHRR